MKAVRKLSTVLHTIKMRMVELQHEKTLTNRKCLTLSNPTSGRGLFPRGGGPQRPPLEINEGVSGEQDSLNTIFNTHKIRIVCKI